MWMQGVEREETCVPERKDVKGICGISWIQVYKNGKVIVAFTFPSEAQKVAHYLIEVGNEKLGKNY